MQATGSLLDSDSIDTITAYEFESDRFPQLSRSMQLKLYQSMENCALSQILLFTRHPDLLETLKNLVQIIYHETQNYQRTQLYGDRVTYIKIISLIDSLEVIDHLGQNEKSREPVKKKLQKQIALWAIPRHLVVKVVKDLMSQDKPINLQIDTTTSRILSNLESKFNHERNKLITANIKLVYSVAKRYRFIGLPFSDLVQEGSIGLLKSIERFDPRKGFLFSTYAYTAISHHIHSAIEKQSSVVRKPYNQLRDKAIADKTRARLEQKLSRPPRSQEYAESLSDSIDNKAPYIALNVHATANIAPYQYSPEPEEHEQMSRVEQDMKTQSLLYKHDLNSLLLRLDNRKQTILRMRYGIEINRTYTLKEISEVLCISSERVRQLSRLAEEELHSLIQERTGNDLPTDN